MILTLMVVSSGSTVSVVVKCVFYGTSNALFVENWTISKMEVKQHKYKYIKPKDKLIGYINYMDQF